MRRAAHLQLPEPPLGGRLSRPAAITFHILDDHVSEIALAPLAELRASAAGGDRPPLAARRAVREAEQELAYLEGVAAAGLSPGQYADGARKRGEAGEETREWLATLLEGERTKGGPATRYVVGPVGRGRGMQVGERARVVAHGAGLIESYCGGGVPLPIRALDVPDRDDPVVLGT